MKNVFLIIVIFVATNIFSQEYKFDKFIMYEQQNFNIENKRNILVYINTENPSYYLIAHNWGTSMNIYLKDKKQNMMHSYKTDNFRSNTDFEYLYSTMLKSTVYSYDCTRFGIKEEKIDSTHNKLTTTKFLNKKKTKIDFKYETFLEPFEYDGLNNFLEMLQGHYVNCNKIQTSEKRIPYLITLRSEKDIDLEIKLKKIESIDIIFKVDKQKIVLKK